MAKAIQRRRGTSAEHASFTGLLGELTIDTTNKRVVLHDGATAGGIAMTKLSETIQMGKHLIGHWGAGGLTRPTTSPADVLAQSESATNKVNDEYLSFPNGSTTYACFCFRAPKSCDESAVLTIEVEWKEAASATAHVCRWQIEAQAQGDGDTIDSAWGTAVAVDDTSASGKRQFCEVDVTPAGSWAAGDKIHVRLARLGGHANDTLDVAAHLLGVTVHGAINAGNDA